MKTSGTSPSSGSPIITLDASSGISSANRFTFCQSIASRRSKPSSSESSDRWASRSSAAASPPRICGPLVRTMRPYSPALAAASSNSVPAVITPLPPLPAIAIEMLAAPSPGAAPAAGAPAVAAFRSALLVTACTFHPAAHDAPSKPAALPFWIDADQGDRRRRAGSSPKSALEYRFRATSIPGADPTSRRTGPAGRPARHGNRNWRTRYR